MSGFKTGDRVFAVVNVGDEVPAVVPTFVVSIVLPGFGNAGHLLRIDGFRDPLPLAHCFKSELAAYVFVRGCIYARFCRTPDDPTKLRIADYFWRIDTKVAAHQRLADT